MALILGIETSTKSCSVALLQDDHVLASRQESSDQYIHSEKLHLFIEEVLQKAAKKPTDLSAVAVGKGPGSYTGLRIGVSAAKGLCYALSIPLLSATSHSILLQQFLEDYTIDDGDLVIPVLDARRMEVYYGVYNASAEQLDSITAMVIDENSFTELKAAKIHLVGDAVQKVTEVLPTSRFEFHHLKYPSAEALCKIASQKIAAGETEDQAYFEPFYLKDFVAGKPKKLL